MTISNKNEKKFIPFFHKGYFLIIGGLVLILLGWPLILTNHPTESVVAIITGVLTLLQGLRRNSRYYEQERKKYYASKNSY